MNKTWTPEQYAARLALIKKVAKKIERRKKAKARRRSVPNIDSSIDKFNINHYTDSEKYVDEHYGSMYRDQVAYDNDWN